MIFIIVGILWSMIGLFFFIPLSEDVRLCDFTNSSLSSKLKLSIVAILCGIVSTLFIMSCWADYIIFNCKASIHFDEKYKSFIYWLKK